MANHKRPLDSTKVYMALTLAYRIVLPTSFGQIGHMMNRSRCGFETVHLPADSSVFRTKDVVDPSIAGGGKSVVGVVGKRESGIEDMRP